MGRWRTGNVMRENDEGCGCCAALQLSLAAAASTKRDRRAAARPLGCDGLSLRWCRCTFGKSVRANKVRF